MGGLKQAVNWMIYLSVLLGLALVYLASSQVPSWLLASLATGEAAYFIAAVGVSRGSRRAYNAVLVLAVLVLAASLPQPEHYSFAGRGQLLQFVVFASGDALQVALLVTIPVYLRRRGRKATFA